MGTLAKWPLSFIPIWAFISYLDVVRRLEQEETQIAVDWRDAVLTLAPFLFHRCVKDAPLLELLFFNFHLDWRKYRSSSISTRRPFTASSLHRNIRIFGRSSLHCWLCISSLDWSLANAANFNRFFIDLSSVFCEIRSQSSFVSFQFN